MNFALETTSNIWQPPAACEALQRFRVRTSHLRVDQRASTTTLANMTDHNPPFCAVAVIIWSILPVLLLFGQEQERPGPCAEGKLRFASSYGSHMVLQQSPQRAVLWGCAPRDAAVIVIQVLGPNAQKTQASVSNETGMWGVALHPINAGGPYSITATLTTPTNDSVTLVDVLFGDVWLCSGQSNMLFEVFKMFNASEELALASEYPDVRFFMVDLVQSPTELPDLTNISIPWSVPNKENLASFSAVCWLFGRYLYKTLKYPIGLVESSWGGTAVEAWSSHNALKKCGLAVGEKFEFQCSRLFGPRENSVLWNAMIRPLVNMTIKGAIWYQGEANTLYHRDQYNCSFPAMIDNWRSAFHEGSAGQTAKLFPFGFVQLSTYKYNSTDDSFPEIRWHQTADYGFVPNFRMKNTFMAVAMDLPDKESPYGPIHPRDKQDVAYRLTLGAQAVAYNMGLTHQGPFPYLILSEKMYVSIAFDQQLTVSPSENIFEICCSTTMTLCDPHSNWVPASIKIWEKNAIVLSAELCAPTEEVAAVRYAWRDWPCDFKACPVYSSKTALPAPPFSINFQSSSGWKRTNSNNHSFSSNNGQKTPTGLV